MQQGVMGLLALLMLGSAWEIGRSEGGVRAPGLSSFSLSSSGSKSAKKSKSAAKKMLAQIKEKSADNDDSKSGFFAAQAGDKKPVEAAAPAKAEPAAADVAVALKAASAKSVDALMGEAKATGDVAKASGAVKAEAPALAGKPPEPANKMAAASKTLRTKQRRKGKFRVGRVTVSGSLAKNHARRTIRKYTNAIKFCYQRQLQRSPTLSGKVTARVTVQSGRVKQVKITQSTLTNKAVEGCITSRIKRFRYPKSRGTSVINYPLIFSR